jgi:gas vesicle structural protein
MAKATPLAQASLASLLESPNASLLDVVDSLLDKGVVLEGEIVLGLADVDLIYVRLCAVLAAADRVFSEKR